MVKGVLKNEKNQENHTEIKFASLSSLTKYSKNPYTPVPSHGISIIHR